ncbi:U2 small nuclear ribonucleoprotein B'' [Monocercomonoides exilis]|uniref:U2 small nuclear ribonucleoprotein B'' n=1 Tax=Monocercomonoides exilis TaxID=2049356 RepID=UPI00355A9D2A|nr:U2 small nuclear ribonucleoprotein B'' [Monocercomonoides exilis]|eukprot:MONOS_10486.1-p1 / transcript=MONOS_10486.1 / gene=MONOS_10486 / organism=Monocercomonoides_exilis_PA203 / gene_product=U2 small nuclear ribonucleoprotein B'' / transcript_product=U2 small nuclear ribonucleoprotein B'' / location=Mono_scaffold00478:46381-47354(-) / protein_length=223 / sequence_SO=supercontig / SO=protein_coding / is_pseudo=false
MIQPQASVATGIATLYVNNLNDKLKKQELKRNLYLLFSQYGIVIDIVCLKTQKMRGQAFIVFRERGMAAIAMKNLQGKNFFGKPMNIAYSKSQSYATMREEGLDPLWMERMVQSEQRILSLLESVKPQNSSEASSSTSSSSVPTIPPNKVIFVQGLSPLRTESNLVALFSKYPGFVEVRLAPTQKEVAFVEYQTIEQSTRAIGGLDGYVMEDGSTLRLSYQK